MCKEQESSWLDQAVLKVMEKMEWVSEKSKNKIPYTTVNGVHDGAKAVNSQEIMGSTGGVMVFGAA